MLESETRERSTMLARVIGLTSQSLRDFTEDYAQWDDMVQFIERPRPRWAAVNLDASLEHFKVTSVWVLRRDGSLVYATSGENAAVRPPFPLPAAALERLLQRPIPGPVFVRRAGQLVELCFAPVQPSDDTKRETAPRGWLVAEHTWNAAHLALLADLLQCEVSVADPGSPLPEAGATHVSLRHPLPGPEGKAIADLIFTVRSRELEIAGNHNRIQIALFVLSWLAAGLVALVCLHFWVLRPLRAVSESLATAQPALIRPLTFRRDELGRIAQLVQTSFEQRNELETMLAERVKLGRELHDGVIQTVYAAGMNLTGARAALRQNPAAAERILDDTHSELNHTIRELRAFIAGLEPEPSSHRTFPEAVRAIVTLMQGVRPIECAVELDEALAAKLTASERLHLLHIIREAVSNSVRHSEARRLRILFRREAAGALLEITDDGAGLEPTLHDEKGRGLANLAARAQELGGTFQLDSQPGSGLRIRVTFPRVG